MKKVLAIAALGVFVLSSCKKDYTCTCTASGFSQSEPYTAMKKKEAEDKCDKKQSDIQTINPNVTCTIN